MNTGIRCPLAGLVAYAPRNTPVLALFSWRSRSDFAAMVARYAATASAGVAAPNVQRVSTSAGHCSATNASTNSCSGASTMYVAPNKVSGRVVNTSISPASVANSTAAPVDRPIQLRCMVLTFSGQSSSPRSSSRRSEYAVMRIIHCRSRFRNTGKFPRSLRPSEVTSSLASTVPSPGHQFTSDSARYTKRYASTTSARSPTDRSDHARPSSRVLAPDSISATSSEMGLALLASGSNHAL